MVHFLSDYMYVKISAKNKKKTIDESRKCALIEFWTSHLRIIFGGTMLDMYHFISKLQETRIGLLF